ncbi:Hypothetical protein NocV09_02500060 [Nannochloropsis oceanica]
MVAVEGMGSGYRKSSGKKLDEDNVDAPERDTPRGNGRRTWAIRRREKTTPHAFTCQACRDSKVKCSGGFPWCFRNCLKCQIQNVADVRKPTRPPSIPPSLSPSAVPMGAQMACEPGKPPGSSHKKEYGGGDGEEELKGGGDDGCGGGGGGGEGDGGGGGGEEGGGEEDRGKERVKEEEEAEEYDEEERGEGRGAPYLDLVFHRHEPQAAVTLLLDAVVVAQKEGRIDRERVRRVLQGWQIQSLLAEQDISWGSSQAIQSITGLDADELNERTLKKRRRRPLWLISRRRKGGTGWGEVEGGWEGEGEGKEEEMRRRREEEEEEVERKGRDKEERGEGGRKGKREEEEEEEEQEEGTLFKTSCSAFPASPASRPPLPSD